MNSMKSRLRSERGAELIEFALVLPLLLMILLGIVDFGFLFQRMQVMTNAAREGARMAVLPGYKPGDVDFRVRDFVRTGGVPTTPENLKISVTDVPIPTTTTPPPSPMKGIRVEVTYTHQYLFIGPIAKLLGGSFASVPVSGVAIMRNEAQ